MIFIIILKILYPIHRLINATAAWTIALIVVIEPIEDLGIVPCDHIFESMVLFLSDKLCHNNSFVCWEKLWILNEWFMANRFKCFINQIEKNCLHAKLVQNQIHSLQRAYQNRYKSYCTWCNKFYTPKMTDCTCWWCSSCRKWWTTKQDWAKHLQTLDQIYLHFQGRNNLPREKTHSETSWTYLCPLSFWGKGLVHTLRISPGLVPWFCLQILSSQPSQGNVSGPC